jgi:poly(3-hydroxyalkanoate) synthetase
VLSSSGHIQSLITPPTNKKTKYLLNPELALSPERLVEARHDDERILVGFVAVLVERAFGTQASGANDTRQRAL